MDNDGLRALLAQCPFTCVAREQAGFVLCMDHTSTDGGPNFDWFRSRYDQFLYVDRIVVDLTQNRKGKLRRYRFRFGRTKDWKKAIVKLEGDHRIDFF